MTSIIVILVNLLLFINSTSAKSIYDPLMQKFIGHSKPDSVTHRPNGHSQSVQNEILYASEVTEDILFSVDCSNATATAVCSLQSPVVAGLEYDPQNGILYGTDTMTLNLLQIDPSSGAVTIIGHMGIESPHGVAIDPADGVLYVAASSSDSLNFSFLYTVDILTAKATLVGPIGYTNIDALDFDPTTGVLYGAAAGPTDNGFLIIINTATGQGTYVSDTHRITGMSFNNSGLLYAVDNGLSFGHPSMLYSINKIDGSWTLIGSMKINNVLGNVLGLAFWTTDTSVEPKSSGNIKAGDSRRQ